MCLPFTPNTVGKEWRLHRHYLSQVNPAWEHVRLSVMCLCADHMLFEEWSCEVLVGQGELFVLLAVPLLQVHVQWSVEGV